MGRVLMFVRIMPADSEVDIALLEERIRNTLPEGFRFVNSSREPIGYGMESLIVGISVPEEEGVTDRLEDHLRSIEGVGEVQVEALSRE
ncbi:MAG: elongation factor 1-beta [Nitrososphaerota archaeon]